MGTEEGGVGLPPLNDSSDLLSSSDSLSSEEDNGDQIEGEETVDLKSSSIATKKTTVFGGAVILLSESSTEEKDDTDTECCEFSLPTPTGHHSSQDHTLQCWEDMLEAAVQQCNSMDAPTMSRTSSEEELATIFGDQDTPVSLPHPPPTSTPPPTQEATYQLFPEKNTDTDFIHKWWEMRNQFLLQQQQSGDHHNLTTTPWTSAEREIESDNVDVQYPGQNKIYGCQALSTPQFSVPPASGDFSFGLTQQQQSSDYHNMTTTPWTLAESKNVIGYHSHTKLCGVWSEP